VNGRNDVSTANEELAQALPPYLAQQRWFGAKDRDHPVRVASIDEVCPGLLRVIAEVGEDRYQLLLGAREGHLGSGAVPAPARVGEVRLGGRPMVVFDALADEALALRALGIAAPGLEAGHARALGVEQSNSSVVYDDAYILKLFRRLASPNPDVEVTVGLWRAGFDHVAEPLGVWRHDGDDLAVVQRFLRDGADGWELAVGAAIARRPFTPEAAAIGALTADLHEALAHAFGTWPASPPDWADAATARVASTVDDRIDRDGVDAVLQRVRTLHDAGVALRAHGDYHLGQVVRSGSRWYVLDFEGEPARPLAERRAPSSPLRDVAGMLRSFGYAAGAARREGAPAAETSEWERSARDAFLAAYFERAGDLVPGDPAAAGALLTAFEVDKAVYEVAYEQGNRPDWVDIPLEGLREVLARSGR
jgi:maltokinase